MLSFKHAHGKIQISLFLLVCPRGRFLVKKMLKFRIHRVFVRCRRTCVLNNSKDENVHRFALSAKKGEHLEREREREKKNVYRKI